MVDGNTENEPPRPPSETLAHFTNRKAEIALLDQCLRTPFGQPIPLISFFDVGGTGKTWLLKKLQKHVKSIQLPTAYLNLEELKQYPQLPLDVLALANIREQLAEFEMPKFDLCLRWYFIKAGFTKEAPLLPGVTQANLVVRLVEGLAGIPLLGDVVSWVAQRMEKSAAIKAYIDLAGLQFYHVLREKTIDELRTALVDWFAEDLANAPVLHYLPEARRGDSQRNYAPMAVVFLDTLEELRKGAIHNTQGIHPDEEWITKIHTPRIPVLFVVAGRDELQWGKSDSRYLNHRVLISHRLRSLARADALEFLDLAKINGDELREAILIASRDLDSQDTACHPFSLGVCADTVHNNQQWGIPNDPAEIRNDAGNKRKIADRFLKSLGSNDAESWIRRLAVTPRFDEAAALAAYSDSDSPAKQAAWRRLLTFSFIRRASSDGFYTFHANMKDALVQTDEQIRSAHQWWSVHWKSRSRHETDDAASLAWYHDYQINPEAGLNAWNALAVRLRGKQIRMAEHYSILNWWHPTEITSKTTLNSAAVLTSLGIELRFASMGDRNQNLQNAIRYYNQALQIHTREQFPIEWAKIMVNRGNAYSDLQYGDRSNNIQEAIRSYVIALQVITREQFPIEWAKIMVNRGNAYNYILYGNRHENIQEAIRYYDFALQVITREQFPIEWAKIMMNKANALLNLPVGDRTDNCQEAIRYYDFALQFITREQFPIEWATILVNRGNAYLDLQTGVRSDNLLEAIRSYNDAAYIFSQISFPFHWAGIMNNIGNAYSELSTGDREVNLREAIRSYDAALLVRTQCNYPLDWAATLCNRGNALRYLRSGNRANNLREAIQSYDFALQVRTREQFPRDWALTKANKALGLASLSDLENEQTNKHQAIELIESAINVFSECGDQHNLQKYQEILDQWRRDWGIS